ncbi:hypothetical protein JJB09_21095 [Rhizobium sp. KVB221]|uniref:Uncharacterized protein n=1 Tax=Rhizobium setariae TaxID=2801340 RepID=A0A937CQI3_9HYPH|nr:hypothetical protein [Rhizobium setariae]MBL0374514.1 hypothetical protein [Rhizobium setariae]
MIRKIEAIPDLTAAEIVVLSALLQWLPNFLYDEKKASSAERRALWNLECALEKRHPSFQQDHDMALEAARHFLTDEE